MHGSYLVLPLDGTQMKHYCATSTVGETNSPEDAHSKIMILNFVLVLSDTVHLNRAYTKSAFCILAVDFSTD